MSIASGASPVQDYYDDDWLGDLFDFVRGGRQDGGPGFGGAFEWIDFGSPVGTGSPFPHIQVPTYVIVPQVGTVPAVVTQGGVSGSTSGATTVPVQTFPQGQGSQTGTQTYNPFYPDEVIVPPVQPATDWFDYWDKMANGVETLPPVGATTGPSVPVQPDGTVTTVEDDTGILGDIYDIVDTSLGGILPGGVDPNFNIFPAGGNFVQTPTQPTTQVVTTPGGAVVTGTGCAEDPMKGMVYKKVCGQYRWVKQKRRRRKALATKGDLSQLASLKGVLGQGKAFEVWIATHS